MEKVYVVKNEDIHVEYDKNGFYMTELLCGTYAGGIRNYKCFLKAGCQVSPQLYREETVILMFGKGRGYVKSAGALHKITEVAFYAPDFDREPYVVHAYEDMEFVLSVVEMNRWDKELYEDCHIRLPYFTLISDAIIYDQDCKGPNTSSWWIFSPKQLGRIMLGVVRAVGEGTVEKGHDRVEQWNYCLGDSYFNMTVEDAPVVNHKAGEWSYIPAGFDHSLLAEPGKEIYYVWYEHYVREKDFCVSLEPGQEWTED